MLLVRFCPLALQRTGSVHTIFDAELGRFSFGRVPSHGNAMPLTRCFSFTPRIVGDLH